jgi:hypothetical protein
MCGEAAESGVARTEMNHEGHEDHEEIVFVLFCGYLEEGGRSRRSARFVSGRVWICLARVIRPRYRDRPRFTPLLFDPDTDTDPDSHTHTHSHTPPHTHASPRAFVLICGAAGTPLPYPLRAVPMGIRLVYFVGDSGRARRP